MDNVFVIADRSMLIAKGVLFTLVGLLFLALSWGAGIWPIRLLGIAGSSIIFVATWWRVVGVVYEIRLTMDGHVEIVRLRGSVAMPAHAIVLVRGERVSDYGKDTWSMRVVSDRGTFTVEFFGRAMELLNDLRARNPTLRVDGEWPVINPWGPQAGGHSGPR